MPLLLILPRVHVPGPYPASPGEFPFTTQTPNRQYCVFMKQNHMEKDMAIMGYKLILRGLKFYDNHGAIPEEKTLGQMFMLDIDAFMSLKKAGLSENLADSVSYVDIYNVAREVVKKPSGGSSGAHSLQKF
ncbi:unnamed protein product [Microthlaspi erraticum]|uniref:dihydroneopterin aldolase n=1 Tax=Microthlaspi erraticum TaxID=1685480 RepID=A0A6D2JDG9_9BRAS|nr:unnamed protein product [Microthlaspi erraticum]